MGVLPILTAAVLLAGGPNDYDFDGASASAVPSRPDVVVLRGSSKVAAATGSFQLGVSDHVTSGEMTYGDRAHFTANVQVGSDVYGIELLSAGFPPAAALGHPARGSEPTAQAKDQERGTGGAGPVEELESPRAPDSVVEGGVMLDRDVFSVSGIGPHQLPRARAAIAVEGIARVSKNGKVIAERAPVEVFALSAGVLDDQEHAVRLSAASRDTELHIRLHDLPIGRGSGDTDLVFEDVTIALRDQTIPAVAFVPEQGSGAGYAQAGEAGEQERGTGGSGMAGTGGSGFPGTGSATNLTAGGNTAPLPAPSTPSSGMAVAGPAVSAGDQANLHSIFPAPSLLNPPRLGYTGNTGTPSTLNQVYPVLPGAVAAAAGTVPTATTSGTTTTSTGAPTTTAANSATTTGSNSGQTAVANAATGYNLGATFSSGGIPGSPTPLNTSAGSSLLQSPTPLNSEPATGLLGTPTPINSTGATTAGTAASLGTGTGGGSTSGITATGGLTTTGTATTTTPTIPGTAGVPGVTPVLPSATDALPGTSPTFSGVQPVVPGATTGTTPGPNPTLTPGPNPSTTPSQTPTVTPAPSATSPTPATAAPASSGTTSAPAGR